MESTFVKLIFLDRFCKLKKVQSTSFDFWNLTKSSTLLQKDATYFKELRGNRFNFKRQGTKNQIGFQMRS